MVALTTLNLPPEAWKSARLLRAVPNCRLVLMLAYHMLSPALSVEDTGLMTYLQTPPEAGPSIAQATSGLQNWKCAGRRLVEVTLIQYATVAGHFPGVNASSVKPKPKKANKVEVTSDEPSKGETQVNATTPATPRPKPKAQAKASPQATPAKVEGKPPEARKEGKGNGKGKRGNLNPVWKRENNSASISLEEHVKEVTSAGTNTR